MAEDHLDELVQARAPAMRRLAAFLADAATFSVVPALVVRPVVDAAGADSSAAGAAALAVAFLTYTLAPAAFLARGGTSGGQTPGKRLLGLRVHAQQSETVSFGRAVGREGVKALCLLLFPVAAISAIPTLFGSRRLSAQDDLADTVVVRDTVSHAVAERLATTPDGSFSRLASSS